MQFSSIILIEKNDFCLSIGNIYFSSAAGMGFKPFHCNPAYIQVNTEYIDFLQTTRLTPPTIKQKYFFGERGFVTHINGLNGNYNNIIHTTLYIFRDCVSLCDHRHHILSYMLQHQCYSQRSSSVMHVTLTEPMQKAGHAESRSSV